MKEDHENGICHVCRKETMVRWKNIYHMGSEGLVVCQPCENKIVKFVQDLRSEECHKKLKAHKKEIINNAR